MARKLTTSEAKAAFEEIVKGLAKQHLRLRFRRKFGTGELMDAAMLVKGTVTAPLDRAVSNLLQEQAPNLTITRIVGTADSLTGESLKTPGAVTIGELISAEEVEQGLIVHGRKARLLVYFDPTESHVYSARETVEFQEPPKPKARTFAKPASRPPARGKRTGGRR
jgi:hypothetical protein